MFARRRRRRDEAHPRRGSSRRRRMRSSKQSRATAPSGRGRIHRRHEHVLRRDGRGALERGAEGEIDPRGQSRGDSVRLQRRPVFPDELLRTGAPLRRREVSHRVAVRGDEHARVVVKLGHGFVRGPPVEPLHRPRVLLRHERRPHRLPQHRQGQSPRLVRAHREFAQAIVLHVVRRARVGVGVVQLFVPARQAPLGLAEIAPARGVRGVGARFRGIARKINHPRNNRVKPAIAPGSTRAAVQLEDVVQITHRARAPSRRDAIQRRLVRVRDRAGRPPGTRVRIGSDRRPPRSPSGCGYVLASVSISAFAFASASPSASSFSSSSSSSGGGAK